MSLDVVPVSLPRAVAQEERALVVSEVTLSLVFCQFFQVEPLVAGFEPVIMTTLIVSFRFKRSKKKKNTTIRAVVEK